jgi:predicted glutamine amidotransferase
MSMCRWLTYSGPPIYLEKLLFEPENSLIQQSLHARKARVSTNGDGFGVGWYGERDVPGTYHEVMPAWNDRNLKSLSHQLQSTLFFAHVRASTGTETSRANCHPFSHGKWLFMHNGQIGGYDRVRRRLDQLILDALYDCRRGTTDSELIFYLLFRNGVEHDPVGAIARTIAEIRDAMLAAGTSEPLRLTAALSNGRRTWAIRYATDAAPPSLYWCVKADEVIIVSEPLDTVANHWNPVPPDHLLIAEAGVQISSQPFPFAASGAVAKVA